MLQAAIPVDAVTATASGVAAYFFRSDAMISRRRTDLPVPAHVSKGGGSPKTKRNAPAEPVKKRLFPSLTTCWSTFCCSELSTTFCLIFRGTPFGAGFSPALSTAARLVLLVAKSFLPGGIDLQTYARDSSHGIGRLEEDD